MDEVDTFLRRRTEISRFARAKRRFSEREIKFQKVEILAAILNQVGEDLESNHFSSGSTVTRTGLQASCKAICGIDNVERMSKKACLGTMLNFFGDELEEGDFISPGSTVTRKALMRIYRFLLMN
tara:strand:- start:696 stop:1070 length:375 start_codon:yes stop_codon:yes gene_type:complete